jgi:hypothetical protein
MSPNTLLGELDRDPFIPLRLHLADGRKVEILNPGLCMIANLALYAFRPGRRHLLASDVDVISLRHIVSIEPIQSEPAAS